MEARWLPVMGYEGVYMVSDHGSVVRVVTQFGTSCWKPCKPSVLRGYLRYHLCWENRVRAYIAHRLVWEAFNGPLLPTVQINHKNGIKDDNRLENLEPCTPSENQRHSIAVLGNGLGSRNGSAKLKEPDISRIFELRAQGLSQQAIADLFGVRQMAISRVLRKVNWAQAS